KLENPFISMAMIPDPDYMKKENEKETEKLKLLQQSLDSNYLFKELPKLNESLILERGKKQDVSCLPTLSISDIAPIPPGLSQVSNEIIGNHSNYTRLLNCVTNDII